MNQYYMPQMPSMELSKYPENQTPEPIKNPPFFPYQMQPPTHPQPYAGYPIHPSMYMAPPILAPPSATSLQSNSAPQKQPKNKTAQEVSNKQSK